MLLLCFLTPVFWESKIIASLHLDVCLLVVECCFEDHRVFAQHIDRRVGKRCFLWSATKQDEFAVGVGDRAIRRGQHSLHQRIVSLAAIVDDA